MVYWRFCARKPPAFLVESARSFMPKYVVRCGVMRALGVFTTSRGEVLLRGTQVIARTDRGLEAGEVLCEASDQAVGQLQDPRKGQVLRQMTAEDRNELARMHDQERSEHAVCER